MYACSVQITNIFDDHDRSLSIRESSLNTNGPNYRLLMGLDCPCTVLGRLALLPCIRTNSVMEVVLSWKFNVSQIVFRCVSVKGINKLPENTPCKPWIHRTDEYHLSSDQVSYACIKESQCIFHTVPSFLSGNLRDILGVEHILSLVNISLHSRPKISRLHLDQGGTYFVRDRNPGLDFR